MKLAIALMFLFLNMGCKTEAVKPALEYYPSSLSWDKVESRKAWSSFMKSTISKSYFDLFDMASDNTRFCSQYSTFSREKKIVLFSEILVWVAFYESSWNPASTSVDVGLKDDKDTWSTGLFQISVTDQYDSLKRIYNYDDLLKPIPNIDLTLKIMARQLKSRNKIILDNSDKMRYWAVLLDGNRDSKVGSIISNVKKAMNCN